jgi:hypothetical protein
LEDLGRVRRNDVEDSFGIAHHCVFVKVVVLADEACTGINIIE